MVPSERMICSPVMSGKPTTVNRIRSPDFNGITSLSSPDLITCPDLTCSDFGVVPAVVGKGMLGLVEKMGEIDGLAIGRVDDSGGIGVGAAIVGAIELRKKSP